MKRSTTVAFLLTVVCLLGAHQFVAHGQVESQSPPSPRASPPPTTPLSAASPTPDASPAAVAPPSSRDINVRAATRPVDATVPDDPAVTEVIAPYRARVAALATVIGRLESELEKGGVGGGSLGNFVTEAMMWRARTALPGERVAIAITNSGGLRKNTIAAGDIRTSDIYELLPFENSLVAVDLTGEQLLRFLRVIVAQRDAQTGARIIYRRDEGVNSNELVGAQLGDARASRGIEPAAIYTIVTIDYLINRGGNYSVLQEAQRTRPLGVTIRDAVLEYVRAETAAGRTLSVNLDGRFRVEGNSNNSGEDEP